MSGRHERRGRATMKDKVVSVAKHPASHVGLLVMVEVVYKFGAEGFIAVLHYIQIPV